VSRKAKARRRPSWRRRLILASWLVGLLAVAVRSGQVQSVQSVTWRAMAEAQQTTHMEVAAPRGTILDRDGAPLAVSQETYKIGVAPHELRDVDQVRRLLEETVGLSPRKARQVVSTERRWGVIPGTYPPAVREKLSGVRGIHLERQLERSHPHGGLARGIVGRVMEGAGRGGIEQQLDDWLGGTAGREVVARDNQGRPIPGEVFQVAAPQPGGEVVLTLDVDLQEIARQALREAVTSTGARGGDVLVTDPHTGEVLAMVSLRNGRTTGLGAINTPYEPGSTLKPFTVAGLLQLGLGSLEDSVDVENGTWRVAGRVLHDVHAEGVMTVSDALRKSSNVGIAKAAQVLPHGQQYENLRDFGFGTLTGIELPGEARGTLPRPREWSAQSPASLAIGYEIAVTPLQMAMAYGALANGGLLMQPRIIKEIRDSRGRTMERTEPRAVRRVVSPAVARSVSDVLVGVVADGTGRAAQLGSLSVAGKSGTSRAYEAGGYARGRYYASFAGFFPAEDPELVVFVKLDDPQGAYYGGAVAAPVTRATMEAVLAARVTPLDRTKLLHAPRPGPVAATAPFRFAANNLTAPRSEMAEADPGAPPTRVGSTVRVPKVAGLATRVAVRRLHALGLRVRQDGPGDVVGTRPGPGALLQPGDTVHLKTLGRADG
jgi:cell division protein FtsI (penicillin-binding protein 3)